MGVMTAERLALLERASVRMVTGGVKHKSLTLGNMPQTMGRIW